MASFFLVQPGAKSWMLELAEFRLIPEFTLGTKLGQNKIGSSKFSSNYSIILVPSTEPKQQLILIFCYFACENILKEFSLTSPYGCLVSAR